MKAAELRTKKPEELRDLITTLKQEQFNLRFQKSLGTLENAARFDVIRKTIARAKTLITEKKEANNA